MMRTIRFHDYGEPGDVLRLEQTDVPEPGPDRIRVAVHACGLNPADWALCRGLFKGLLPRGIGLEVGGVVDAIGEGVSDVAVGDRVMGTPDYASCTSAGAADRAILNHWAKIPDRLDYMHAAALPMAVETASRTLDNLAVVPGQAIVINGAGTTVGYAAVQIALDRGARVIATAGDTYADRLRALGATVTPYGEGLAERLRTLGPIDLAMDTAPPSGALPELVKAVGGDPKRVFTISDTASATALGVRNTFGEPAKLRHDAFADYASRAGAGTFSIPIARALPLEDWRTALEISSSGKARGKLVLLLS